MLLLLPLLRFTDVYCVAFVAPASCSFAAALLLCCCFAAACAAAVAAFAANWCYVMQKENTLHLLFTNIHDTQLWLRLEHAVMNDRNTIAHTDTCNTKF